MNQEERRQRRQKMCIRDSYYGAADSYVGLAFTELDDIIDYIKEHSVVTTTDTEIGKR